MAASGDAVENPKVLTQPTVLKGISKSWSCSSWNIRSLERFLGDKMIYFRVGRKNTELLNVQFEGECEYIEATMRDFAEWCKQSIPQDKQAVSSAAASAPSQQPLPPPPPSPSSSSVLSSSSFANSSLQDEVQHQAEGKGPPKITLNRPNPLMSYDRESHWCYADYKHMVELFKDCPHLLKDVRWTDLGYPDHDGCKSTIWIGSEGANTPCHQDTYGFNLVAQISGRKRWHLFPPSQTDLMYPTRIPYEESSIFSQVNVGSPDLTRYPMFGLATPFVVTLCPGDILFVPKHWWHYVECLDVSVSINCWMDLESDHLSRVDEAISRTIICGLMSSSLYSTSDDGCDDDANDNRNTERKNSNERLRWLNPTEEMTDPRTNMIYLNSALRLVRHYKDNSAQMRNDASEVQGDQRNKGAPHIEFLHNTETKEEQEDFKRGSPGVDVVRLMAEEQKLGCAGSSEQIQNNFNLGSCSQSEKDIGKVLGERRVGESIKLCEASDDLMCTRQHTSRSLRGPKCSRQHESETFHEIEFLREYELGASSEQDRHPTKHDFETSSDHQDSKHQHIIYTGGSAIERSITINSKPDLCGGRKDETSNPRKRKMYLSKEKEQGPAEHSKRLNKDTSTVVIPGSQFRIPAHLAAVVDSHWPVATLTKSQEANDLSNLKHNHESEADLPEDAALQSGGLFNDISMATLVECLTHPKVITTVRQLLVEKISLR